ncbi:MAG: hypothetical protein MGG11_20290 [Trichodesmium sp. MAG_R03]|nr:hypothetical protein [Trichodesmium sp. MAG_R03]
MANMSLMVVGEERSPSKPQLYFGNNTLLKRNREFIKEVVRKAEER